MAYGMTENLGLTALRGDEWLEHPGSVGRGFRDTEIRILDSQQRPLGPGEDGDVYLRAPMSAGYRYLGGAPRCRRPRTASAPPGTSATSTRTATSTSSTAGST